MKLRWIHTLFAIFLISYFSLAAFAQPAASNCARADLAHQQQDEATVQRLEKAWSIAYLTGDTEFEACLLTQDFMEIMSNGSVNHLREELALAEKNNGKSLDNPNLPPSTVHIHGNVAVAYGISPAKMVDGKAHKSYFADFYVWSDGAWHVYFAQQTSFVV